MTLDLTNLHTAIQGRVNALGPSTDEKALLLLSKAIEAAAGNVSLSELLNQTDTGILALEAAAANLLAGLDQAGLDRLNAINSAGEVKWCGVAGGTSNVLTLTPAGAITALVDGMVVRFVPSQANAAVTRANAGRNAAGAGAVAGTPGTMPGYWSAFSTGDIQTQVVSTTVNTDGVSYTTQVRFFGTTTAVRSCGVNFESGATSAAAAAGQVWSVAFEAALVAGTIPAGALVRGVIREANSTGSTVANNYYALPALTAVPSRTPGTATLTGATTAHIYHFLDVGSIPAGRDVDFTLAVTRPMMAQSPYDTPFFPTTAAAGTVSDGYANLAVSALPRMPLMDAAGNILPPGALTAGAPAAATWVAAARQWRLQAGLPAATATETAAGTLITKAVTPAGAAATFLKSAGGNVSGAVSKTLATMTPSSNTYTMDCSVANEFDAGVINGNAVFANPINAPTGKEQDFSIRTKMNAAGGYVFSFGSNWFAVGNGAINNYSNKYNVITGKIYPDGAVLYSIAKGV